jgi:hypothetical protein
MGLFHRQGVLLKMIRRHPIRLGALTVAMLLVFGGSQARPQTAGADLKSITVSFKFDPGPTYGGVRWVDPPFTSGMQVGQLTIDVKVQGTDRNGKPASVMPNWTPEDPQMVSVAPIRGDEYRITVRRPGDSKLILSTQNVSKALMVKAKAFGDGKALQAQVSAISADTGPTSIAKPQAEITEPASDQASPFQSSLEKQSYALGVNTATQLHMRSISIDTDVFMQGLKDSLGGGKTQLTEQDVRATLVNLRLEQKKKMLARKREKRVNTKSSGIKVSFKQDSDLDSLVQSGETWVSPPSFVVFQDSVEAKAQRLLSTGSVTDINSTWTPADPEMIAVSPRDGNAVTISVKRPGESKLTVSSRGIAKDLLIRAKYVAGTAMQLEISQ